MGKNKPGEQDGSGPYKNSFMSRILKRKGKKTTVIGIVGILVLAVAIGW